MIPAAGTVWAGRAPIAVAAFLPPILALLIAAGARGPDAGTFAALGCILLLGVPHGALDAEIARPYLQPRFGSVWFAVFAIPYLVLAGIVLIAWHLAPISTLAVFLAASVIHFGREDAAAGPYRPTNMPLAARGGLPVALPVLLHPAATARFLGVVSQTAMPHLPPWLVAASLLWCPVALCWALDAARRSRWHDLADAGLAAAIFAALPPLAAFTAYFVCLHAPRHMAALIHAHRAPRVTTWPAAIRLAAPVTMLTVLVGAVLWRHYPGHPADRLLTLTIQGLAALTLPHMLLEIATEHPSPNGRADQPSTVRRLSSGNDDNNDGVRTTDRARPG